eukprot:scaffold15804_cov153-Skeletonema_dohrnii-CCMP3373.AAC.2
MIHLISRRECYNITNCVHSDLNELAASQLFDLVVSSPFNWGLPALPHKKDAREIEWCVISLVPQKFGHAKLFVLGSTPVL